MSYPQSGSIRRANVGICGEVGRLIALLGVTASLTACDLRWPGESLWGDGRPKLGPRIVQLGQPVPKGGGHYKLGEPYRSNGRLYVPREIDHYDETGIASWYGELFHGRRTANGEIYDMEALSAAHPTLPLPCYARVTNLQNGRSLVVRVNDRGPYARDRIIDLSWAVASLLQMRDAGTAPVRVQYLGPAPLNGDDSYERAMLARQPWAGPRVAYAASPAKAMRYRQISRVEGYSPPKISAAEPRPAFKKETRPDRNVSELTPPVPARHANTQRTAFVRGHQAPHTMAAAIANKDHRRAIGPASTAATAMLPSKPQKPVVAAAAATPPRREIADRFAGVYVDAGVFSKPELARQLAEILNEIAPTRVESVTMGAHTAHRLRLGPFKGSAEAKAALARIRAAGLTNARMAALQGG